jgi:hypothetical protein
MATGINLKNLQLHSIETTATRCMPYGWVDEIIGLQPFANCERQISHVNLFSRRKKLRSSLTAN